MSPKLDGGLIPSRINPISGDKSSPQTYMANLKSDLQLAIVGCGRIVENNHLPALAKISNASLVWVVDSDVERARAIGRRVGAGWSKDVIQIPDSIDAALVAVPNHLHVHLCEELLERGIHVLCEKPMAIASVECAGIVKTVERTQKLFAVVHQLRLFWHSGYLATSVMQRWVHYMRAEWGGEWTPPQQSIWNSNPGFVGT
jgi:predicted dehydrogenase